MFVGSDWENSCVCVCEKNETTVLWRLTRTVEGVCRNKGIELGEACVFALPQSVEGPFGEDLRDALGGRKYSSSVGFSGRKVVGMGRVDDKQGARNPIALVLGDDVRVLAGRRLCGVRRIGQHLLSL